MEELTCPNCHEKFKTDPDRKYFDCPHCHFEFAERDLKTTPSSTVPVQAMSLLDKIKNAKKNR